METYDFSGKTVVLFATSGSSGIEGAVKDFKAAYPAINWNEGKLLNGATAQTIKEWVETLK